VNVLLKLERTECVLYCR